MIRIRTKREIEFITASCQIVSDTLDMLTNCLLYTSPSPRD